VRGRAVVAFAFVAEAIAEMFEPTPHAPWQARRFIESALDRFQAQDLCPVAVLLTSELVTNVVQHAATPVDVAVSWDEPTLRVEVSDGSSILPAIADTVAGGGGRGLLIVSRLARHWGVTPRGVGKAVWFTVDRSVGVSARLS
jgi:anti-sigma regulatory factor (Ser/Thr protein kinase)